MLEYSNAVYCGEFDQKGFPAHGMGIFINTLGPWKGNIIFGSTDYNIWTAGNYINIVGDEEIQVGQIYFEDSVQMRKGIAYKPDGTSEVFDQVWAK